MGGVRPAAGGVIIFFLAAAAGVSIFFYAAGAEITVKEPKEKPEKEAVKKNDNRTGKNTKPRNTAD